MATAPQVIPSWFRSHSASGQAAWGQATWHGIIHFDHPAKPSSYQSDPRPPGIAPEGSTTRLGLSKVRRDRDGCHDRCNHVVSFPFDSPSVTNAEFCSLRPILLYLLLTRQRRLPWGKSRAIIGAYLPGAVGRRLLNNKSRVKRESQDVLSVALASPDRHSGK